MAADGGRMNFLKKWAPWYVIQSKSCQPYTYAHRSSTQGDSVGFAYDYNNHCNNDNYNWKSHECKEDGRGKEEVGMRRGSVENNINTVCLHI